MGEQREGRIGDQEVQGTVFGIGLRHLQGIATMLGNWKLWYFWGGGRKPMGFVGQKTAMVRGDFLSCSKHAKPPQFKKESYNNQLQERYGYHYYCSGSFFRQRI